MNPPQPAPQARIWQLVLGFVNTSVLYALVEAGVLEEMRERARTLPELAEACALDADTLFRVLRYAEVIGVVERERDRYTPSETGRLILKDVPGSLHVGLRLFGSEPWRRSWQNLGHSLSTGESAFEKTMGAAFFPFLDAHPEYGIPFHHWMTISTSAVARAVAEAYDFSPYSSVCDVGGGQGILLKTILESNPRLRGILYDQESVVKDHLLAGLDGRVEIRQGSFFDRVPPADILMMKSILHDWSDEKCGIILQRCREAMRPNDRLLVIDMVIGSPADFMGVYFDLLMKVIANGRERTEEDFRRLLEGAGLKLRRIVPTNSPMNIVEASL